MHSYLERLETALPLPTLLLVFWSMFWLLNGLDKFFNRPRFFGVTRDQAFVEYFAQLNLPSPLALASLYGCGTLEIMLGAGFIAALALNAPVLTRLCFKASIIIFMIFTVADVLFGDRQELWEHATYLTLVLVSAMVVRIEPRTSTAESGTAATGSEVLRIGSADRVP